MVIRLCYIRFWGSPGGLIVKSSPANARDTGEVGPLEEELATHYCILIWKIPWTEKPGSLQPRGSQRTVLYMTEHIGTHLRFHLNRLELEILLHSLISEVAMLEKPT